MVNESEIFLNSTMAHPNSDLATAIHRAADLLIERELSHADRTEAMAHVVAAVATLERGSIRREDDRVSAFLAEMIPPAGETIVRPGQPLAGFAASPYSGDANALRPTAVEYRAIERGVQATVVMGVALEGRPGRAHGGATAAVFDDVMGAVQRTIGRSGYTRTLTISYYGAVPVYAPVAFEALFTGEENGRFTVEASATYEGKVVAKGVGVFTEVTIQAFGAKAAD